MQLAVHTPCQQRWVQMNANETGRFCDHCQKTVVDFAAMTDEQVIAYLQGSNQSTCGRFRADQLNRNLMPATSLPASSAGIRWMSLLTAGLLNWSTAQGQPTDGNVLKSERIAYESVRERPGSTSLSTAITSDSTQLVSGRVVDGGGQAIPSATVTIKETKRETTIGADGNFAIELSDYHASTVTLVVGSIGYVSQEITRQVANAQPLIITLTEDVAGLGAVVVTGNYTVKKLTVLQKVKNRFRKKR